VAETVIQLPTGGTATIKGTPAEIAEVLKLAGMTSDTSGRKRSKTKTTNRRASSTKAKRAAKTGPLGYTRQLKDDGFFKTERGLAEVQQALRTAGHIYRVNDLAPALVRLVRQRELGRLKGKSGKWTYVAR
jgi:hypothetical protein